MANRTWRALVKAKRQRAEFRIVLTVRGKKIVKTYHNETDFRKWKAAYEENCRLEQNGIEDMRVEIEYR
jgi:hypothetical protein